MSKPIPDFDALDPLDSSETSDPPVFPEGSQHPTPDQGDQGEVASGAGPDEERTRGAQGRYGLSEEPDENAEPVPQTPKTVDQSARDRQRDRVVRETGEDVG